MSASAELQDTDRLIPLAAICEQMRCTPAALTRACTKHGVRLIALTQKTRGLMPADYAVLLERSSAPTTEPEHIP